SARGGAMWLCRARPAGNPPANSAMTGGEWYNGAYCRIVPAHPRCRFRTPTMSSTPFPPTSHPLAAARLKPWYLPVAAVLSGLVLRLFWLGHKSLWLDEARSLIFAQSD